MCPVCKNLFCLLLLLFFIHAIAIAQDTDEVQNTKRQLIKSGDTLQTNTGIRIIVGQKVKIGKAAGNNGWYKSIGFKTFISWPVLLFHDLEIKSDYQYHNTYDPEQERENDKVKENLREGDSLLVTRIRKHGSKKRGYWYWLLLRDTKFPPINYRCTPEIAITTRELIFE